MEGFADEGIEAKSIYSIGSNQLISPGGGGDEKEQLKLVLWRRKFAINSLERRTKKHARISGTAVLQLWFCGGTKGQPDWFLEGCAPDTIKVN